MYIDVIDRHVLVGNNISINSLMPASSCWRWVDAPWRLCDVSVMHISAFLGLKSTKNIALIWEFIVHREICVHFEIRNFQPDFSDWCLRYLLRDDVKWMSLGLADEKPVLVHVMAWSRQAISHYPRHYPSRCWPRFMPPYGVTKPLWVNHGEAITYISVDQGMDSRGTF